jgi:hypothetical protein
MVIGEDGRVDYVSVLEKPGDDAIADALAFAAMGAATNFEFIAATFCVSSYGPDGYSIVESCGENRAVALDYKSTFALQEVTEQVAIEDVAVTEREGGVLNFEGIVREAGSKDPLADVEVAVEVPKPGVPKDAPIDERYESITAITDEEGRFALRGIPVGEHRVSYSLSGFEPSFSDETFSATERTQVIIYLQPRQTAKFETVIRRKRAQKEVAKVSLSRDEVKRVPGTFGDPIRVIENLPGLARAPFAGGALIVRGANPQDSGTYFDGVEIPLLYHFGGLTSVVNAEFLEDISFYPGGFGAYYGRATAGIVDVSSRKPEAALVPRLRRGRHPRRRLLLRLPDQDRRAADLHLRRRRAPQLHRRPVARRARRLPRHRPGHRRHAGLLGLPDEDRDEPAAGHDLQPLCLRQQRRPQGVSRATPARRVSPSASTPRSIASWGAGIGSWRPGSRTASSPSPASRGSRSTPTTPATRAAPRPASRSASTPGTGASATSCSGMSRRTSRSAPASTTSVPPSAPPSRCHCRWRSGPSRGSFRASRGPSRPSPRAA